MKSVLNNFFDRMNTKVQLALCGIALLSGVSQTVLAQDSSADAQAYNANKIELTNDDGSRENLNWRDFCNLLSVDDDKLSIVEQELDFIASTKSGQECLANAKKEAGKVFFSTKDDMVNGSFSYWGMMCVNINFDHLCAIGYVDNDGNQQFHTVAEAIFHELSHLGNPEIYESMINGSKEDTRWGANKDIPELKGNQTYEDFVEYDSLSRDAKRNLVLNGAEMTQDQRDSVNLSMVTFFQYKETCKDVLGQDSTVSKYQLDLTPTKAEENRVIDLVNDFREEAGLGSARGDYSNISNVTGVRLDRALTSSDVISGSWTKDMARKAVQSPKTFTP